MTGTDGYHNERAGRVYSTPLNLDEWSHEEPDTLAVDVHTATVHLSAGDDAGQALRLCSLGELFREAARRTPGAVAVRDATSELTYAQLVAAAAEQAHRLRAAGVRPGDTVLIGVPRSVAETVAVLGTVWVGAAYVGIDLSWPSPHLSAIAGKCSPTAAVLERQPTPAALRDLTVVDAWELTWEGGSDVPAAPAPVGPEAPAYVAFTSGSTGMPKGVCVPHRAVSHLVSGAHYVRLKPGERMLRLAPLAFDASTFEIWGSLLTGTTLEVYPQGLPSPSEVGEFLVERGVTVAWVTAGFFRLLVDFAIDSLGGLRHLLTGGDVVPHEHVTQVLTRHPGVTVTNGYGPTENTTFTTTHSVTHPQEVDGSLPIGTPVPGTRVHVLDARGLRVPQGVVGELYVAGEGLALGYVGDAAETARRFGHFSPDVAERLYRTGDLVRVDDTGRLHFVGRADEQVKVRGHRIEPSAISALLCAQPGVRDAVVFAVGPDSASRRLVAAVVQAADGTLAASELRNRLAEELPAYMIPVLWAVVDRLPVTANGKVDREPLAAAAVFVP